MSDIYTIKDTYDEEELPVRYMLFDDGTKLKVLDAYSYVYDTGIGRQVLRVRLKAEPNDYVDLYKLFSTKSNRLILHELTVLPGSKPSLETGKLVTSDNVIGIFNHFTKNLQISYNSDPDYPGHYSVELERMRDIELQTKENTEIAALASEAICELYEAGLK